MILLKKKRSASVLVKNRGENRETLMKERDGIGLKENSLGGGGYQLKKKTVEFNVHRKKA